MLCFGRPSRSARCVRARTWRRGTTLIELLVVIGIIGVLISMLIPSLKRTMQLAASTVCMHNLREIGHGLMLYRFDYDGWLPTDLIPEEVLEDTVTASARKDTWFEKMVPAYLQDPLIMTCPKDPYRYRMVDALDRWDNAPDIGDYASYGLNRFIMTAAGGTLADLDRHRPLRPADTILVADLGPDTLRGVPEPFRPKNGPRRPRGLLAMNDGYDPLNVHFTAPWLTQRHGHGINMLTATIEVRPVSTVEMMQNPVRTYYEDCAAGGCALCNARASSFPFMYHYSFAKDRLFWWTGSLSLD